MTQGSSFLGAGVGEPSRRALLALDRRLGEVQAALATDITDHVADADPHPQYMTQSESDARYLLLSGGTLTGELVITGSSPQMKFSDAEHDDFWIHVNENNFYILPDRDDSGNWETPYALQLEADTNTAYTFGNRILTVADEGTGNGLDADTLDGSHASAFAASSHTHSYLSNNTNTEWTSGQFTFRSADVLETASADQATLEVYQDTAGADAFMQFHVASDYAMYFGLKGDINDFAVGGWSKGANYYRVWHAGNDGSGSGLDADTLDGSHASAFAASAHTHSYLSTSGGTLSGNLVFSGDSYIQFEGSTADGYETFLRATNPTADRTIYLPNATGTLSLDGHTHSYAATSHTHSYVPTSGGTMTGELQVNARLDVGDGTNGDHEIRIYKADNNVSDHIQFYNGTTRVGEIGCEDTTWLRINQETAKNIYTPRYIRADGGFFVDGSTYGITGTGAGYFNGNVEAVSGNVVVSRPNALMLNGSSDNNHKIYSLNNANTALPWSDGPVMVGYTGWGMYCEEENVWRMGLRGSTGNTYRYGWYNCNLIVGSVPNDALNTDTLRVQGTGRFTGELTTENKLNANLVSNQQWWGGTVLANTGSGRATFVMHPGGVAPQFIGVQNDGTVYLRNSVDSAYRALAAIIYNQSSVHSKQDIVSFPAKITSPAGSAVDPEYFPTAIDLVNKLRPVYYRWKEDQDLDQVPTGRRLEALLRLQKYNERTGRPFYTGPDLVHKCGRDCDHSENDPCNRVRNWMNGKIGLIAQEVGEVVPECANIDPKSGEYESLDAPALSALCIAALQELSAKISQLEGAA